MRRPLDRFGHGLGRVPCVGRSVRGGQLRPVPQGDHARAGRGLGDERASRERHRVLGLPRQQAHERGRREPRVVPRREHVRDVSLDAVRAVLEGQAQHGLDVDERSARYASRARRAHRGRQGLRRLPQHGHQERGAEGRPARQGLSLPEQLLRRVPHAPRLLQEGGAEPARLSAVPHGLRPPAVGDVGELEARCALLREAGRGPSRGRGRSDVRSTATCRTGTTRTAPPGASWASGFRCPRTSSGPPTGRPS